MEEKSVEHSIKYVIPYLYRFPTPEEMTDLQKSDLYWTSEYYTSFSSIKGGKKGISIAPHFKLFKRNEPESKPLLFLEVISIFHVTRKISYEAKLTIFELLLDSAFDIYRGAYAAYTEGTPLSDILPPYKWHDINHEFIKKLIGQSWNV